MASSLKCASRRGLTERFDGSIGAGSVLMPFGGKTQRTPAQAMAALFPVLPGQETDQASVMSWGCDPEALSADPYQGPTTPSIPPWPRLWPPAPIIKRPT